MPVGDANIAPAILYLKLGKDPPQTGDTQGERFRWRCAGNRKNDDAGDDEDKSSYCSPL
jgi:hypothetical protein